MNASPEETQIAGFVDKFDPALQAQLREARANLRALFPRGYELVFDNYNALVFAFSPNERSAGAFISIAGYPKWVTLFFLDGKALDDPDGLLVGEGKQVRGIRLGAAADLDRPAVRALIAAATLPHAAAFATAPALSTIVRTVVAKQRPRRPATKA